MIECIRIKSPIKRRGDNITKWFVFHARVDFRKIQREEAKDPTIAEKFNTYKFGEYKESVIELLMKVCTASVETMKIVKEMPE